MSGPEQYARQIVRTLRAKGHQAYLVGGCVRDLLLGREPADFDVTTDAMPEQVIQLFPETYAVGVQFGVVLVPLPKAIANREHPHRESSEEQRRTVHRGHPEVVEVATFRSDIGHTDGRHPDQVRYSKDARQDVARRDFTINGLLLDPVNNQVLDFVEGRRDLEAHLVRTIGDPERRFTEDKLRMMRAIRFAARFQYRIEAATFAAMQKLAPQIHQVSRERLRDELTKMLTEGHAREAFLLLDESRLLGEVLPEIAQLKGVEQPVEFHPEGDVWVHTLLLLDKLPPGCAPTLAWGALLHDVGKPPTFRVAPDRIRFDGHVEVGVKMGEEICRRFHFSNQDSEQILALIANHMRFAQVENMRESTLRRFMRLPQFEQHLELHRIDCQSSHGDLRSYNFARQKLAETPPRLIRPTPLVTGRDLIKAGYTPGPSFKQILSAVEDLQLEGKLQSPEAAMEFVRHEFPL